MCVHTNQIANQKTANKGLKILLSDQLQQHQRLEITSYNSSLLHPNSL